MLWEFVFWGSLICLLHSYALFPWLLGRLAAGRRQNSMVFDPNDPDLPTVSILLAVFNEEKVLAQKILTTIQTDYPLEKIEFLIGSDASTDKSDAIIRSYAEEFPQIRMVPFAGRTGKAGIVNSLAAQARGEIFILTDANVFFRRDTIYQLVKHYLNPRIALVGGNILNQRVKADGISVQEKTYLSRENRIKYEEGVLWGAMIGAFGGCYSLRKAYFAPVPPRFFMDDFYITMNVLEKGGHAINELNALCYEDVSNKISEEFRRKVRISIGNFQNLLRYRGLLWPVWSGKGFAFLSHKVLRWLGPFFIILMLISSAILAQDSAFYGWLLAGQAALLVVPVLDAVLRRAHVHLLLLRFVSHFYLMNLALLVGFFRFVKGVESNIWKPTQRYQ